LDCNSDVSDEGLSDRNSENCPLGKSEACSDGSTLRVDVCLGEEDFIIDGMIEEICGGTCDGNADLVTVGVSEANAGDVCDAITVRLLAGLGIKEDVGVHDGSRVYVGKSDGPIESEGTLDRDGEGVGIFESEGREERLGGIDGSADGLNNGI
jgi:hypothetical protein